MSDQWSWWAWNCSALKPYGMVSFASALSFLDFGEKAKTMLIFFLSAYKDVTIPLSPATWQGTSFLLWLCYTDICDTFNSLRKKKDSEKSLCNCVTARGTFVLQGAFSSLQSMVFLVILSRIKTEVCDFVYICESIDTYRFGEQSVVDVRRVMIIIPYLRQASQFAAVR